MSEQAAIATCEGCQTPLQEGWIVCPQCGTSTSGSAASDRHSGLAVSEGRPAFSVMDDQSAVDLSLGRARLLSDGETLGDKYRVIRSLGAGGFGEVYQVEDRDLNRHVALKVVKVDGNGAAIAEKQLVQEFAIREKINDSSHIIKACNPWPCKHKHASLLLLPMELADGGSLRHWLTQCRNDEGCRVEGLDLFKQACLGVGAIHKSGAVHLDIKPENILIASGEAKVSDFGIGRFCGQGFEENPDRLIRRGLGTPRYMSPEQFRVNRLKDIGPASDIYSLGLVLYEILDGRPPFDGTREELEEKHRNSSPAPLKDAAEPWWPIVKRCLAKNPDDRYQSVAHLIKDLDRAGRGAALSVDLACPECSHVNDNELVQSCEKCGADISALFRQCPRCYYDNRVDAETCRSCGHDVATHFQREERRKTVANLKDMDPAAAIGLLETVLRQGHGEEEASLIRELREGLRQTKDPIAEAERAAECGELERAINAWGRVLEVFPRHKIALKRKAELESLLTAVEGRQAEATGLMDAAWFDEAEKLLLECSEIVPSREDTRQQLVTCRRRAKAFTSRFKEAADAHRTGALVRAEELAVAALAQAPDSQDGRVLQAEVQDAMKRAGSLLLQARKQLSLAEFDEAEKSAREAEEVQSDLDGVDVLKKEVVSKRKLYERAIDQAERARNGRDLRTALASVNSALSACPDSPAAKAFARSVGEDQERAKRLVHVAQEALLRAEFEEVAGDLQNAERLWEKFGALDNTKSVFTEFRESYERSMKEARAALAEKDLEVALQAAGSALELCPESQEALDLAKSANGDSDEVLTHVARARNLLKAAEFDAARGAVREAKLLWVTFGKCAGLESEIDSTEKEFDEAVRAASAALRRRDFTGALSACSRALTPCPDSREPRSLAEQIEDRWTRDIENRRWARARRKTLIKWSVLTLPCVGGLVLLMTTNATCGAIAAGIAAGASLLNWQVHTELYQRLRYWAPLEDTQQAVVALLGPLLIAAGIAGAASGWAFGGSLGTAALLITGFAHLFFPAVALGYALRELGSARAATKILLAVAAAAGGITALVFGAMWLWGWATGSLWPWCRAHQFLLVGVFVALSVIQLIICRVKAIDARSEPRVWLLASLVHVLCAGIVVGICILTAVFLFGVPWHSGVAAGHLVNVARSCVGIVLALCSERRQFAEDDARVWGLHRLPTT